MCPEQDLEHHQNFLQFLMRSCKEHFDEECFILEIRIAYQFLIRLSLFLLC